MSGLRALGFAVAISGVLLAVPAVAEPRGGTLAAEPIAGYDRISIDWRQAVDYDVRRSGDVVEVVFDTALPFTRKDSGPAETTWLRGLRVADNRLILKLTPSVLLRHYRTGRRFVIDLLPPASPGPRQLALGPSR